MYVSVLLTSLPLPFERAAARAAALGFRHVDVVALADRPAAHRGALADSGLLVSCAAVGRDLPAGLALDAASAADRRAAVGQVRRQIADAAALGATHCYVVPGADGSPAALARFGEACGLLAEFAARRMVRLCVEPAPGRALPDAAAALAWLGRPGHSALSLLLDVGHCLLSGEDAAAVVRRAGPRLGYVHVDDNDGAGDLHWPLFTGRLTEEALARTVAALCEAGYDGAVTLELSPKNADPEGALGQGKAILERLLTT